VSVDAMTQQFSCSVAPPCCHHGRWSG